MSTETEILKRVRTRLEEIYGARLVGVILYGSTARGTAGADSDIDLLVLLRGPVISSNEITHIWNHISPLNIESPRPLSFMPVDAEKYQRAELPMLRNARADGVLV